MKTRSLAGVKLYYCEAPTYYRTDKGMAYFVRLEHGQRVAYHIVSRQQLMKWITPDVVLAAA